MNTSYLSSINLSYEQFKQQVEKITDLRDAALVAIIYCGYARVGEIVKGNYSENPPITVDQLEFVDRHLKITILTEKTHRNRTAITNNEFDGWLHDIIIDYLASQDMENKNELFPFTTRWAQYRFEKWFGTQHIHLLRHWSCTHALQGKRSREKLKPYVVATQGGWLNLNTFYRTYSHAVIEDYIETI
jgi:integrase